MTQHTNYVPSQYTHLASVYSQNQFVTIQKLLRNLSYNCLYNARYPILKILKAICRRMLINEFEGVFFAFVVQTNRWNISDEVIKKHYAEVRDIVCYSTESPQYKSLTLYLLLCAYTVKYYLNEDVQMYTIEMNKICPDFKDIFESWAKQYAQTTLKINPKNLNKAYKQIFLSQEDACIEYDYNSLVDNLLQISPSYNPEKDKDKSEHPSQNTGKEETKKQYIKQEQIKQESSGFTPSNPLVSSALVNLQVSNSGYVQQITPLGNSGMSGINAQKIINLNNSTYGFNHLLGEDDCIGDVNIGFRAAESDCQDNNKFIVKEENNEEEIPFRKKASNLSGYLR